jgi:hypothetical protein
VTVFGAALDVLVNDPNLGVDGTFTPSGGIAVSLRLMLTRHDPKIDVFQVGARAAAWKAVLRQADVAVRPAAGDIVTVGAQTFTVRDVEVDALGLAWRVDLDEAA